MTSQIAQKTQDTQLKAIASADYLAKLSLTKTYFDQLRNRQELSNFDWTYYLGY